MGVDVGLRYVGRRRRWLTMRATGATLLSHYHSRSEFLDRRFFRSMKMKNGAPNWDAKASPFEMSSCGVESLVVVDRSKAIPREASRRSTPRTTRQMFTSTTQI